MGRQRCQGGGDQQQRPRGTGRVPLEGGMLSFEYPYTNVLLRMASGITGKPPTGLAKGAERCRRGRGTSSPTGLPGLKGSPCGTESLPHSGEQSPRPRCLPAQAPSSQHRTAHDGRSPWRAAPVTHTSLRLGSSCWS